MSGARIPAIAEPLHRAADAGAVAQAYQDRLGCLRQYEGIVSATDARRWDAPVMAGRRWVTLAPASDANCLLRLVERPAAAGYRALTSFGWIATEVTVAGGADAPSGLIRGAAGERIAFAAAARSPLLVAQGCDPGRSIDDARA